MLTKLLKSLRFPGLGVQYVIGDETLTEEGAAADAKKVGQELAKKVDKETGKALSTNDYTNAEKTKLAGVDSGAQVNTIEGVKVDGTEVTPDAQKKVNLNVYDKAAINAIVQEIYAEVAKKLNIDGYSEAATVGNALGLVTDSVVEDKEPYNFRSLAHLPVGKFCYDTIVGGSIVWNQLYKLTAGNITEKGVTLTKSADGTILVNGTPSESGNVLGVAVKNVQNHIYYLAGNSNNSGLKLSSQAYGYETNNGKVIKNTSANASWYYTIRIDSSLVGVQITNAKLRPIVIDLTSALPSTIADYIYSLEQTTAGAGVAWVRKYLPEVYYGFAEPHFEHVQVSAKNTVGFNQWDEEYKIGYYQNDGTFVPYNGSVASKNFIPVLPNTTYYIYGDSRYSAGTKLFFYTADEEQISRSSINLKSTFTTPANCSKMLFYTFAVSGITTYNNDICINLHGDRDGEYEAYRKRTYPLDSSLTLRGIPKLDSANRLSFDGDIYRHDGSGEERYGFIDLGTLNWIVYRAERCIYRAVLQNLKVPGNTEIPNIMTPKYKTVTGNDTWVSGDIATTSSSTDYIFVCDTNYTDVASFKTAMSGVYLLYELKTPEPFTAEPYQSPMVVDPLGTEEFVDYAVEQGERDVKIPCGHTSEYPEDLVDKLEVLPHATGTNGDYLITELNGKLYLKPYTQTVGLTSVSETEAE